MKLAYVNETAIILKPGLELEDEVVDVLLDWSGVGAIGLVSSASQILYTNQYRY